MWRKVPERLREAGSNRKLGWIFAQEICSVALSGQRCCLIYSFVIYKLYDLIDFVGFKREMTTCGSSIVRNTWSIVAAEPL